MKKKELKELATKIAKCEYVIQTSSDKQKVMRAQDEVMALCGRVDSIEDITAIDEIAQDILQKLLDK